MIRDGLYVLLGGAIGAALLIATLIILGLLHGPT